MEISDAMEGKIVAVGVLTSLTVEKQVDFVEGFSMGPIPSSSTTTISLEMIVEAGGMRESHSLFPPGKRAGLLLVADVDAFRQAHPEMEVKQIDEPRKVVGDDSGFDHS